MISFKHVNKIYPSGQQALKNINLQIDAGEMAFVTGHSGAGKSSLLKLIAMIERPTRGEVIVAGCQCSQLPSKKIPHLRRAMGLIFQSPKLLNDRNVFDNVALPLVIAGTKRAEVKKRVHAALDKVGLLKKAHRSPMSLSGGEQQRVGIARAVVHKPAILLADEPTGNLDPELSAEIMQLFEEFNQVGVSVLIASHDIALIQSMGKRIIKLEQGQLI